MAFRFKDKERPRGYTSKVASLLHVRPICAREGRFQGDAVSRVCPHHHLLPGCCCPHPEMRRRN